MKAITTKFLPCTDTKPARVTATDGDNRITISYNDDLSPEDAHFRAADALCKKLHWTGKLAAGATKTGYVFVFVPNTVDMLHWLKESHDALRSQSQLGPALTEGQLWLMTQIACCIKRNEEI